MNNQMLMGQNGSINQLETLLRHSDIPTLPMIARKVVDLCQDENVNFAQFSQVIESDAGLASRLMRVANSAYYGLRHKATTVERAITALGLKYVKSISLGFHLASSLSTLKAEGFDMAEFWRQNVFRGVLARQLAGACCPARREEAFLVGLLQDAGIPLLVEALGESYAQLWHDSQNSQASLFQLEKEVFEFNHLMAAVVIMRQWSLPEILAYPIGTHHLKSQTLPSLDEQVQLCQIAYFVGTLSLNNPPALAEEDLTLPDFCSRAFGLDPADFSTLLRQAKQEFAGIAQLFAGILPERVNITDLLAQANKLLVRLAAEAPVEMFNLAEAAKRLEERRTDASTYAS